MPRAKKAAPAPKRKSKAKVETKTPRTGKAPAKAAAKDSKQKPRVTVKSVIMHGIETGRSANFILAQVLKKTGKEGRIADVRLYANHAVKAGTLTLEAAQKKYGCRGGPGRPAAAKGTKAPTQVNAEPKAASRRSKTNAKPKAATRRRKKTA